MSDVVGSGGVLALDIGGSQIRAAAVLADGSRVARRAARNPLERGAAGVVAESVALLEAARAELAADTAARLAGVGISSAGPVDPRRGVIVDPPNMPPVRDVPIAPLVEAAVDLPAFLDRDTNVAALAEQWAGAAKGAADFLYITVSTGLGGAIVHGGRVLHGPDGTAGELGHGRVLAGEAVPCGCGGVSHLEAIASGSGLARQGTAAVAAGRSPFLAARIATGPLTGRDVAEGELAGDETCIELMNRARRAFGIACVGWVNMFNPELIVVGGTVAERQGERWLATARELVASQAFRMPASRARIVAAGLGADVGLAGAWPLVMERLADRR